MNYRGVVVRQWQANKIVAQKLDVAAADVHNAVVNQVNDVKVGAIRVLYYSSCFTDKYCDVCTSQCVEDERLILGVLILSKRVIQFVRCY